MWRQWIEDDFEANSNIFTCDTSSKNFEPELIIKDEEQVKKVLETLEINLDIIKTFYVHKIAMSEKYPYIDYTSMLTIIDDMKSCEVETKLMDS